MQTTKAATSYESSSRTHIFVSLHALRSICANPVKTVEIKDIDLGTLNMTHDPPTIPSILSSIQLLVYIIRLITWKQINSCDLAEK